ncbi:hypothetical protein [Nesterenkonia haasae]|uniref:hypothetical protein n=1 Tax=Nesterenkonia haasae TaxID=2587813 RepID=UPI0013910BFF|nr:hypothetical protein [Nesterenkonia haasae]NDK32452.1 hypothetical protein [Nesterenkonia haasae]
MNSHLTDILPKRYESRDGSHVELTGSKVHLPVGGHRFRPTLEDVLEMLINDFGIDHKKDSARRAIRDGRRNFRLGQVSAAATDAPLVAQEAIHGRPSDKERTDRLEAF